MARPKKLNIKKPAAQQESLKGFDAQNSTPSPSKRKYVKRASSLSPEQALQRRKLATFVVVKYVQASCINWGRDLLIAYKLVDKYPDFHFWRSLPCLSKIKTMVSLNGERSKAKLKLYYKLFKERVELHRNVKIEIKKTHVFELEKVGEDALIPKKKPKSILEFCK